MGDYDMDFGGDMANFIHNTTRDEHEQRLREEREWQRAHQVYLPFRPPAVPLDRHGLRDTGNIMPPAFYDELLKSYFALTNAYRAACDKNIDRKMLTAWNLVYQERNGALRDEAARLLKDGLRSATGDAAFTTDHSALVDVFLNLLVKSRQEYDEQYARVMESLQHHILSDQ